MRKFFMAATALTAFCSGSVFAECDLADPTCSPVASARKEAAKCDRNDPKCEPVAPVAPKQIEADCGVHNPTCKPVPPTDEQKI